MILDTASYKQEALRQLEDHITYRPLSSDPTATIQQKSLHFMDEGKEMGVLDQKIVDYLMVTHPITLVFHHLPKVHKQDNPVKGHLIVAGNRSLLERLGEWVDRFLQPLVVRLPGFIKDTGYLLAHMQEMFWSTECIWITIDVRSLNFCIPHSLALLAIKHHLSCYSGYSPNVREFICRAVEILLTHNFFMFDE